MTKKGKGSYVQATEGNDRSGGWKQPRRNPTRQYTSNLTKNLKFFIWSLALQMTVIIMLKLSLDIGDQYIAIMGLFSTLISGLLVVLKK